MPGAGFDFAFVFGAGGGFGLGFGDGPVFALRCDVAIVSAAVAGSVFTDAYRRLFCELE